MNRPSKVTVPLVNCVRQKCFFYPVCTNATSKVDMSVNQCVIFSVGLFTDLWHLLVLVIIHFVICAGYGATFRKTGCVGQHETSKEKKTADDDNDDDKTST